MGNIKIRNLDKASSAEVYSGNLLAGALSVDAGYGTITRSFDFNQIVSGGSGVLAAPGSPFVFNNTSVEQVFEGGISIPGNIALMGDFDATGNINLTGQISGNTTGYFNKLYITGSDSQWHQITTGWSGSSPGAGASYWSENSSDIYYNAGDVGIGTDAPEVGLTVKGKYGILVKENQGALNNQWNLIQGSISEQPGSTDYGVSIKQVTEAITDEYAMSFWTRSGTAFPQSESMRLSSEGYLGIGTTSPTHGLTVMEKGGIAVGEDTSPAPDGTQFLMVQGGNKFALSYGSSIKLVKEGPAITDFGMSFWTMDQPSAADEKMRLSSAGKLGIGITDPISKLHVDGNITCGNRLIVSGNADVSGYGLFGDGLKVSGDAEISGILSVSTDSQTEGGQFVLNLPGSSGPEEGTGTFSIDAFNDTTNAFGFGPNSGLFRMFHGGGGVGGVPATQILATSSGSAVVLGDREGVGAAPPEFVNLTVGRGTPISRDWTPFKSNGTDINENGVVVYTNSLQPSEYGCAATLALFGGVFHPNPELTQMSASISSNATGLHIRNHNVPASAALGGNMNIVFDLTYNSAQGKAPALQLSGQDNAVILDYDSLPDLDPTLRGQIYRDGDFLKISAG